MRTLIDDWIRPAWRGVRRLLGELRAQPGPYRLVLVLLAIDLFWIVYFGIGRSLYELDISSRLYNHKELMITTDGGVPEWFNYLQTVLVVILLVRLVRSTQQMIYVVLSLMFVFVVLDDAREIHETCGKYFVRLLEIRPSFGMRRNDIGELITWGLVGLVTLPGLLVGLARARPPHRENGLAILLGFGALLFCAMFVDQLYHSFHDLFTVAGVLIDLVEDGGEMLAITGVCALAFGAQVKTTSGR